MKKRYAPLIVTIIALCLLAVIIYGGYRLGEAVFINAATAGKNYTVRIGDGTAEEKNDAIVDGFDMQAFREQWRVETVSMKSSRGEHLIPADHIIAWDGAKDADTVILVHGLGGDRQSVYPIAQMFLEMGFNALCYDQRASGENQAEYCTYGYYEKYDLADCVSYLDIFLSADKLRGVWGVSMGGATAGQYAAMSEAAASIDFFILDSPVSNMRDLLEVEIEKLDIPLPTGLMLFCGDVAFRANLGFGYKQTELPILLADCSIPCLIAYSEADTLTRPYMARDIYQALPEGAGRLFSVEDSAHADIFFDHPLQYRREVNALIESVR